MYHDEDDAPDRWTREDQELFEHDKRVAERNRQREAAQRKTNHDNEK